jgi:hypothetical protein
LNKKFLGGGESFYRHYPLSNQSKEKYPPGKDSSSHLNPGKILDVLNKINNGLWETLIECCFVKMSLLLMPKLVTGRWDWG